MRGDNELGTCSNPQLIAQLGFGPSVRARELHCRSGWSADLWQAASDDVVLDIRIRRPDGESGPEGTPSNAAEREAPIDPADALLLEGFDRVISLTMAVDQQTEP